MLLKPLLIKIILLLFTATTLVACATTEVQQPPPATVIAAPTEVPTVTPTATTLPTPSPTLASTEPFARFAELMSDWPATTAEARQALLDELQTYLQGLPSGLESLTDPEALAQLIAQLQPHLRSEQQLQIADLDGDGTPELLVAVLPPAAVIRQTPAGLIVEDLPGPRYWPLDSVWPTIEQVIDLTGDRQPEIIFIYNAPGGSSLSQELLVAGREAGAWVEWLRLPLNNWAGGGEWLLDDQVDPPALVTTCAVFGTFDAKLVAHPLQRNTYRWAGDHFAWENLEQDEPANLRQLINLLEAGLRLGHIEVVLDTYRYLAIQQPNLPDEPPGATSQGKPDWIAFAALRAGQIHALLGQEEGTLALLSQAEASGSTIGRLAGHFRQQYEAGGDPASAWAALLTDTEIYRDAYNDQGNLVSFPGNSLGALYPGMALAAVLNNRPEALNDGPDGLRSAWGKYGLEVGDILVADLDGNGRQEVVAIQHLAAAPDSWPVWLLVQGQGWFAAPLGEVYEANVTIEGPLPIPNTFYQAVKVAHLVRGWQGHWVVPYQDSQSWLLDTDPTMLCPVLFPSALSPASVIVPSEPLPSISTPEPPPAPAAGQPEAQMEPLATAAKITFMSWSPDDETVAYLEHTPSDLAVLGPFPPGTLKFLKARTGQTCDSAITFPEGDYNRFGQLTWLPAGRLVVTPDGQIRWGLPCEGDFTLVPDEADLNSAMPDPALSPGGTYRATTTSTYEADGTISAVTTIATVSTGDVKNVMDWRHLGGLGGIDLGGQWLTGETFLIYETLDQGPLLVTVGQEIKQVAPELFGLPPVLNPEPENFVGLRAAGATLTGTDTYHLIIFGIGIEADFPNLHLYHSETGEVEELPFRYIGGPIFSPDGRWLVLEARPIKEGYERSEIWLRPVDPAGSEARRFSDRDVTLSAWSPDWTRVAGETPGGIALFASPDGTYLGSWGGGEYNIYPLAWSPTGEFLAVHGILRHSRGEGLFIIQGDP